MNIGLIAEDRTKKVVLRLGPSGKYRLEVAGRKIRSFRNLGAAFAAYRKEIEENESANNQAKDL